MEAMTAYRASVKPKSKSKSKSTEQIEVETERIETITRELHRFSRWCGPDRELSSLSPALIGEYTERVSGGAGTDPQAVERLQVLRGFLSYAWKKQMLPEKLAQSVIVPKRKARQRARGDAAERVELTQQGHARLKKQLDDLKAERGPLAAQIQRAAADKDVRENAPLEAAREQLGLVESRIREIEASLRAAVVVDSSSGSSSVVRIGSRVSVRDLGTGRESVYTLVDRTESNPLEGKISDISPIGKMIVRKSLGDKIEVETPRGTTRYEIIEVSG